jgi:hypothetical protein
MRYISSIAGSTGKRDRPSKNIQHTVFSCNIYKELPDQNTSPTKRMKTTNKLGSSASSSSRIFGDEISTNNPIEDFGNANPFRSESAICKGENDTVTSDCGTEVTSVAQLRGILHGFGQKNQHHYIKNVAVPSKDELEKPIRPKVRPSVHEKPGPTPLPKHSADALVRRMMDNNHSHNGGTASSSTTPSIFRARSTPVRIRIKATPAEDVQATNDGYASVAKLSKWLADDPTSTKKVKQLRRGANIIAKSRKFDKVLANAEVEQIIPRNCVTRSKILLQKALSSEDGEDDDNVSIKSFQPMTKGSDPPDWMKLGTTASMSVADKKKWLSNAFHSSNTASDNETTGYPVNKARTEILSSRDNDIGNLAKEKWRKRTPTKPPSFLSTPTCAEPNATEEQLIVVSLNTESSNILLKEESVSAAMETVKRHNGSSSRHDARNSCSTNSVIADTYTNGGNNGMVDFHLARNILVQRSKANGNDVESLNAFKIRKSKFEMLEKESNRRKSSLASNNILKSSWEKGEKKEGYIKKYVDDIAPKKMLTDLP